MEEIGTGEHWLAVQAKEKGLVDEIMTSDEYLESICEEFDIIEILEKHDKRGQSVVRLLGDKLGAAFDSVKATADLIHSVAEAPARGPTAMAVV
jgi:ClpP class serine protease